MLSYDELTTIRNNLQRNDVEVDNEFIRDVWFPVYRRHFLKQALSRTYDCKKAFYLYHQQADVDCSDVVLFHRIQQMMKVTCNALRQQIINREGNANFLYPFCFKKIWNFFISWEKWEYDLFLLKHTLM